MPTPENNDGAKRRSTELLAEADRLLEELPAQIESAKQERERAVRLRKKLVPPTRRGGDRGS
jgi:hypothetical protein